MYSCPLPSFSGRSRASASGTKSPLRKGRECGWVAWFPWGLPGRGPRAAHCRRGCRDRAFPYSGDISKREAWCASNSSSTLRRFGCQSASMEPLLVRRPATSCVATSRGNVMLFCGLGNHVDLRGLRGGAEGNRTPDLCSAIAALSHLSYSPVARLFTCASDLCQRHRR